MNIIKIITLFLLLPLQVRADSIPLGNIDVRLEVTAHHKIEVGNPHGGWYSSIKLESSPENHSLYQKELPVTVKLRRQEGFRISVKNPLILTRHSTARAGADQAFSPAQVRWGTDRANLRVLSTIPEAFNVAQGKTRQTSTDYILHISALAPSGPNSAGKYHGQLTLIFETNS